MRNLKKKIKKRFVKTILSIVIVVLSGISFTYGSFSDKKYPAGVEFKYETITRKGNFGDNWCQTWTSDGNIYTMMDDGNGWWGSEIKREERHYLQGSMCIQIRGEANFSDSDVQQMPGWPRNEFHSSHYAYGTISVDGIIYVWLWKSETDKMYRRSIANRLLYSPDLGQNFYRWDGLHENEDTFENVDSLAYFFYKEDPKWHIDRYAYAFNWIAFGQHGKDNSQAKDNYVYMYAPEQYDPRNLSLIRVDKKNIRDKSKYEYFKGWQNEKPEWTKDMKERGVNLRYPESRSDGEWMWASWFPDVVYNPGLDLHIMVSYGVTDPGKQFWDGWCGKCKYPASLGFWYAENPWGPWKQFHYTEYFYADRQENRTYGFKLSPKWISEDGKTMHLIWSDAGDGHDTNYKWNQMEIEILIE
jgi:hypothetical protein